MARHRVALAVIVGVLCLGAARAVSASDRETTAFPRRGLGFAAGSMSGIGLSYKQHSGHWAGQVAGGLRKTTSEFDVNLGAVLQRTLHLTTITGDALKIDGLALKTRFYGLTGLGYFRGRQEYDVFDYRSTPLIRIGAHTEVTSTLHTGAGIGMEFMVFQRVGIAMDGVYDFGFKSIDVSDPTLGDSQRSASEDDGLEIQFLPGIAAHYYF